MRLETKEDFRQWMHKVLDPLASLYSEGGARLHLGDSGVTYPQVSIEMEAFSRPLWALVPFWAGGGRDEKFEEIYVKGLTNGTDPGHEEYWGGFTDYDQRFVEMAAIASGMIFAPEKVWEPLSSQAKQNLADWLYGINQYIIPDCNWQFFMILVNVALRKHGYRYDQEKLDSGLKKVESYYLGEGWYRDGGSAQKDYYISFAMHYYGLLYAAAMEKEEPERCRQFKDRAELFARDFIYWFDEDGSALPYGRSLAYRFGEAAFWSAYVFAGLKGIPAAVVKGILSRHLNWWDPCVDYEEKGVMVSSIVDPETVGQYTGLTDKNGNKIFEGDIIAYEDETPGQYEYHDSLFINRGVIRFDDGQFYFTNSIAATMDDLLYKGTLDCEVIGNIHDNPELLEGKK